MEMTTIDSVLAQDLGFTEGPLWTCRSTMMVVGLSRGLVHEVDPQSGALIRSVDVGGHPNGLTEGADGDTWITQAGHGAVGPSIQCIRGDRVLSFAGELNAPNDLAFGPDGLLWFTDPFGVPFDEVPTPGRIWTLDTRTGDFTLQSQGLLYPNGLAFPPTGDALYVAETSTARIIRMAFSPGCLGEPQLFAQMEAGNPDGIAFDRDGKLYVAATKARNVQVFSPAGELVEVIALPEDGFPTNLCFGGADRQVLYVTSAKGGKILAQPRSVAGLPLLPAA